MPKTGKGSKLSCFYLHGTLYKIGDTAFINPDQPCAPPFIGKIKQIVQKSSTDEDEVELTVAWYYRPGEDTFVFEQDNLGRVEQIGSHVAAASFRRCSIVPSTWQSHTSAWPVALKMQIEEAIGGRKAFHGHKELFTSDHEDIVHKNTVIGKCNVHTLRSYENLRHIAEHDYFARFSYKPATKEFEPDRVPVYCTCELPYNPDLPMIMCDVCEEWYHLKCLEEGDNKVDFRQSYVCDQCKIKQKRARIEGAAEQTT